MAVKWKEKKYQPIYQPNWKNINLYQPRKINLNLVLHLWKHVKKNTNSKKLKYCFVVCDIIEHTGSTKGVLIQDNDIYFYKEAIQILLSLYLRSSQTTIQILLNNNLKYSF